MKIEISTNTLSCGVREDTLLRAIKYILDAMYLSGTNNGLVYVESQIADERERLLRIIQSGKNVTANDINVSFYEVAAAVLAKTRPLLNSMLADVLRGWVNRGSVTNVFKQALTDHDTVTILHKDDNSAASKWHLPTVSQSGIYMLYGNMTECIPLRIVQLSTTSNSITRLVGSSKDAFRLPKEVLVNRVVRFYRPGEWATEVQFAN